MSSIEDTDTLKENPTPTPKKVTTFSSGNKSHIALKKSTLLYILCSILVAIFASLFMFTDLIYDSFKGVRIHTFGDSHSRWPKELISLIDPKYPVKLKVHHLGPKLMNTFGRRKMDFLDVSSYKVVEKDIVVFSLGEIDARVHLHKHITRLGKSMKVEITRLVSEYFEAISMNVAKYKNVTVWIQGLVPPTDVCFDKAFPRTGSFNERLTYYLFMNYQLAQFSQRYGYEYLDFYGPYTDNDGGLLSSLGDGCVHIEKFLKESKMMIAELTKKHFDRINKH